MNGLRGGGDDTSVKDVIDGPLKRSASVLTHHQIPFTLTAVKVDRHLTVGVQLRMRSTCGGILCGGLIFS